MCVNTTTRSKYISNDFEEATIDALQSGAGIRLFPNDLESDFTEKQYSQIENI